MKIIFLNTWNCKLKEPIKKFVKAHRASTDIFCFQEANKEARIYFSKWLEEFQPTSAYKYAKNHYSQATFIKSDLPSKSTEVIFPENKKLGLGLYTKVITKGKILNLINVHGISQPGDKLDNSYRLFQSKTLISKLKNVKGPKIIGGDFNLEKEAKSIKVFEKAGYTNLIKKNKIKTTRNNHAWRKYRTKQYYADYAFVSKDIKVKSFKVPKEIVSDHQPMILEFDLIN